LPKPVIFHESRKAEYRRPPIMVGNDNPMYGLRGELSPHFKGFKYCLDCGKQLSRRAPTKCHACDSLDKIKGKAFCSGCGKQLSGSLNRKRVSGKCRRCWQLGENTLIHRQLRGVLEARQWRSDIFTRDNFTCQSCGKIGGDLHAHHIKHFFKILEENNIQTLKEGISCAELWNLNNGVTLCIPCHKKAHKIKMLGE